MQLKKIEAGRDQLDWAIRLLVEHSAALPALTLAGAAEEIFGGLLGSKSILAQVRDEMGPPPVGAPKVADLLNHTRNWLKHNSPGSPQSLEIDDLAADAAMMIHRACTNLWAVNETTPESLPLLREWMRLRMPGMHEFLERGGAP